MATVYLNTPQSFNAIANNIAKIYAPQLRKELEALENWQHPETRESLKQYILRRYQEKYAGRVVASTSRSYGPLEFHAYHVQGKVLSNDETFQAQRKAVTAELYSWTCGQEFNVRELEVYKQLYIRINDCGSDAFNKLTFVFDPMLFFYTVPHDPVHSSTFSHFLDTDEELNTLLNDHYEKIHLAIKDYIDASFAALDLCTRTRTLIKAMAENPGIWHLLSDDQKALHQKKYQKRDPLAVPILTEEEQKKRQDVNVLLNKTVLLKR